MKNIVISIPNTLLSDGLSNSLMRGKHQVYRENRLEQLIDTCVVTNADVLLCEARNYAPYTVGEWVAKRQAIRAEQPRCKLALIVDENSFPDAAKEVQQARSEDLIDAFFFATVSSEYVFAVIDSL